MTLWAHDPDSNGQYIPWSHSGNEKVYLLEHPAGYFEFRQVADGA